VWAMNCKICVTVVLSLAVSPVAQTQTRKTQTSKPATLSARIDQVRSSVVRVTCRGPETGMRGTGFFVNADGDVVTAEHVVHVCDAPGSLVNIEVPLEDTPHHGNVVMTGNFAHFPATILALDQSHDIAILKPSRDNPLSLAYKPRISIILPNGQKPPGLRPRSAALIDSHHLKDGESVFVSGYPLDLPVLVTTSGAIATSDAVEIGPPKNGEKGVAVKDIYWADLTANHGNSGGPVFSLETGMVVGIQVGIKIAPVEPPLGQAASSLDPRYSAGL
jgi:S1-C subfamily serine protease